MENSELKSILSEGPSFRIQPRRTNFNKLCSEIKNDIKAGIENWAVKESIPVNAFVLWRNEVYKRIHEQIRKIRYKPRRTKYQSINKPSIKAALRDLHEKFVITLVDKSTNNIAFICKIFYFKKLLEEVGIGPNTQISQTYQHISKEEKTLIDELRNLDIPKCRPLKNNNKEHELPFMYLLLKMLKKTNIKFRYIVSSINSPLKALAKTVAKILKQVYLKKRKLLQTIKVI